jgi:hypothetical protein
VHRKSPPVHYFSSSSNYLAFSAAGVPVYARWSGNPPGYYPAQIIRHDDASGKWIVEFYEDKFQKALASREVIAIWAIGTQMELSFKQVGDSEMSCEESSSKSQVGEQGRGILLEECE